MGFGIFFLGFFLPEVKAMYATRWFVARMTGTLIEVFSDENNMSSGFLGKTAALAYRDEHAPGWQVGQFRCELMSKLFN